MDSSFLDRCVTAAKCFCWLIDRRDFLVHFHLQCVYLYYELSKGKKKKKKGGNQQVCQEKGSAIFIPF